MMLVNGENGCSIEIADRGFQYGDGLFETIAVNNGQPVFFEQHLSRLQAGCRRLGIPFPNPQILVFESKQLCSGAANAVLKLIITRGVGGRGYRQPDLIQPTRVLSLHPFPDYPLSYKTQGIVARFCRTPLGLNPALAGIKHLNRLEQVMARAEWDDASIQEGIMLDANGRVIEGTMTNLFYIKNTRIYTAALVQAGVSGIIRNIIIRLLAIRGIAVTECAFTRDELLDADEVFVCNSIVGVWPVKQIETNRFLVGAMTQQIQAWLQQFQHETLSVAQ